MDCPIPFSEKDASLRPFSEDNHTRSARPFNTRTTTSGPRGARCRSPVAQKPRFWRARAENVAVIRLAAAHSPRIPVESRRRGGNRPPIPHRPTAWRVRLGGVRPAILPYDATLRPRFAASAAGAALPQGRPRGRPARRGRSIWPATGENTLCEPTFRFIRAATERWPSGRRRSPAKGVEVKSFSWVRIPSSPPL